MRDAVPHLLKILESYDKHDPGQRAMMCAAIRALGHIGDKRAVPVLKRFADVANDFPFDRRGRKRIANIHSTSQSLGLQGFAELALKEIASARQTEPGIKQPGYLASKEYFYPFSRGYNFLAGRIRGVLYYRFKDNPADLAEYFWGIGGTGFHNAWGLGAVVQDYRSFLLQVSDTGLRVVEPMPLDKNLFGGRAFYKRYRSNELLHKPGTEEVIFFARDIPAFCGFWSEEVYPGIQVEASDFTAYLEEKYGPRFRELFGLEKGAEVAVPQEKDRWNKKKLWAEYLTPAGDKIIEDWREGQEWLHSLRKGCAFTFSISVRSCMTHAIGVYPRAGAVIDAHGPESYASHGRENSFTMELARDGEARSPMCEFYYWYCQSLDHAERGFAAHLVHGGCFFNFYLPHIFEQAPADWLWVWQKGRWDRARRVFTKARRVKQFLGHTGSAANIAMVFSDRTNALFYVKSLSDRDPRGRRYYQNQVALWVAIEQSHLPIDVIWAETLTRSKLERYKVIVLSDAKSMTPREETLIREWVAAGGGLIVTGTTSLFDQWGEQRKDYGLADVFGISYKGYGGIKRAQDSDTFAWDRGQPTIRVVDEGYDPDKIRTHVHREVKPIKSVRVFETRKGSRYFAGIRLPALVEYDAALGYDRIKVKKAEILATWAHGGPALTVNRFDKGLCFFLAPIYPGLSHVASGWEMYANYFRFWPGAREIIGSLVKAGLAESGAKAPARVQNCPLEVELTIRTQAERNRWIVHLLNYDPALQRVRGCFITLRPPSMKGLKVFYPDTGTPVAFCRGPREIHFLLRDFSVHEMYRCGVRMSFMC